MTRKQLHLREPQNRDKHPEPDAAGSSPDAQEPGTGKVANDNNKVGHTAPTQRNEGRRTPESRHDRESRIGGQNQPKTQRGGPGSST